MIPISVCIPVYNGSDYLEECLGSVFAQTFSDFEVVLVDDNSSDHSLDIAQRYAASDDRICVFHNKLNLGLVNNWNRCVELSRGQWIKFVFQDDLLEPDCLKRMIEAGNHKKGIIACRRKIIFEDVDNNSRRSFEKFVRNISIDTIFGGRSSIAPDDFCQAILKHLGKNFIGEPTAVMIHRNIFHRFGGFDPKFIQLCDLEYWARVCCNCGIEYIQDTLATFRVHGVSTTSINRNRWAFKMKELDPLLLYYKFAFNPDFQRLRDNAISGHQNYNLEFLTAMKAIKAFFIAKILSKIEKKSDVSPETELKFFLLEHPRICQSIYFKRHKIFGPFFLYERLFMLIYRHIFTRFSL